MNVFVSERQLGSSFETAEKAIEPFLHERLMLPNFRGIVMLPSCDISYCAGSWKDSVKLKVNLAVVPDHGRYILRVSITRWDAGHQLTIVAGICVSLGMALTFYVENKVDEMGGLIGFIVATAVLTLPFVITDALTLRRAFKELDKAYTVVVR